MTGTAAAPFSLLLAVPQSLLRRTVADVARSLQLADVHEVASVAAAERLMETESFDALLLDLDAGAAALDLLVRVRERRTRCAPTLPIAVLAAVCTAEHIARLKQLEVRRVLLTPFKVKDMVTSITALRAEPVGHA